MKKSNFTSSKKFNDIFFYAVMSAFPIVHFCIFYIGVNFNSVLNMFRMYDVTGNYVWNFTASFKKLITVMETDSLMKYALPNSIIGYLVVSILGSIMGILFSYYIYKKAPCSGFFKLMLFLPQIISTMVMCALYVYLVEVMIPATFKNLFGIEMNGLLENSKNRFTVIMVYCVWVNFGGSLLLYLGAMQNISDSVVEAAELDGAVGIREFIYITFPSIYPTITTFVVVGLVGIFTEQFHVYSFYGDYAQPQIYTLGYYLFSMISKAEGSMVNYPMLSALGNIMTLIAVPLTLGVKYLMERFGPSVEERAHGKK